MKNAKILIVEDDFLGRNLLTRMVQPYGSVDVAVDGQEGVDAFKSGFDSGKAYDLVLLDIMMPTKDGQTALKEMRDIERERGVLPTDACKIVMITALGDAKNVMAAFRSQCEGYITKPYGSESVTEQLEKLGFERA